MGVVRFSRKRLCEAVDICEVLEEYSQSDELSWNLRKIKKSIWADINKIDQENKDRQNQDTESRKSE